MQWANHISIHALRGEGDNGLPIPFTQYSAVFLSTPSVGRATLRRAYAEGVARISIHALRGEGDNTDWDAFGRGIGISIHALRGEGDRLHYLKYGEEFISIHALRGEGDITKSVQSGCSKNFYPRPPWGGRRLDAQQGAISVQFLSTPSVGRATAEVERANAPVMISIHALRGEGDSSL